MNLPHTLLVPDQIDSEILPYEVVCLATDVLVYGTPGGVAGVPPGS